MSALAQITNELIAELAPLTFGTLVTHHPTPICGLTHRNKPSQPQ
ncbi:MAG: hypothetical protein ACE366_23475 [Bradymonadia bacterium]